MRKTSRIFDLETWLPNRVAQCYIRVTEQIHVTHVLKITQRINQGNVTYESNNYFINFIIIFNNVEELHHHHYHLPSWRDADFIHFVIVIKDVEKNLYFQDIIIFNAIMLCWIKMNLFWMLECAVMYPPPPYPPPPVTKCVFLACGRS